MDREEGQEESQPQKPVVKKTRARKPFNNMGEESQEGTTGTVRGAC